VAACPHCGNTTRYTDPNMVVRCTRCFNHTNDQAPGEPIGELQDLDAPIAIVHYTPPREPIHHGR
jgi:hypothetical protein